MGVAKQRSSHLNLTQNSHFNDCGSSDFYEMLKNGFFDLKDIHTNTKINQIGCKTKYMTQNAIFMTLTDPLVLIGFLANSVSFFDRFQ